MRTQQQTEKSNVIAMRKHNKKQINWDNSYQVCRLLQEEIMYSMKAGVKISHIANKINMSHSTVSRMGYGETKDPRANTILNLLRFYGYKVTIS